MGQADLITRAQQRLQEWRFKRQGVEHNISEPHTSENNDFEDIKLDVAGGFGASAKKESDEVSEIGLGDPNRMTSGRSSNARKNSV
jgi:hypothetical protein